MSKTLLSIAYGSIAPIAVSTKPTAGRSRMGLALDAKQNLVLHLAHNQVQ